MIPDLPVDPERIISQVVRRHRAEASTSLNEAVRTFLQVGNALLVAGTRLQRSSLDDQLLHIAGIEALLGDSLGYAISVREHLKSLMILPRES